MSRLTEVSKVTRHIESAATHFQEDLLFTYPRRHESLAFSRAAGEASCGTSIEIEMNAAEKLSSFTDSPHEVRAANIETIKEVRESIAEISPSMANRLVPFRRLPTPPEAS